jgi:uncharacterized membrane protein YtjA (UPF0391 family)
MFRHYRVFLIEVVINTMSGYTNTANAAVGSTIKVFYIGFYASSIKPM